MQKKTRSYHTADEKSLDKIIFPLVPGDRIFFVGDLGSGKSTYIRALLRSHYADPNLIVRSPTYTYYQKYSGIVGSDTNTIPLSRDPAIPLSCYPTIYHFDLYRIDDAGVFFSIGGDEIADDPESIMLIEWPEILGESISPTRTVSIRALHDGSRTIDIIEHE